MANKLISTMKMPDGTSYDIDAIYLGGYEAEDYAQKHTALIRVPITDSRLSGVDLGGKTVYFDTSAGYADYFSTGGATISFSGGYVVNTSISPPSMAVCGTTVYDVTSSPYWKYASLTLPSDVGTISTISNWTNDVGGLITVEIDGDIDCEYNYNEIQALKANSGIYKHNIEIDTGSSYFIYVDVYTSSNTPITTASQLFAVLGTKYTVGSHNGMSGYGAVTFYFNSAGTAITIYGVVASGTTVNTVNLSNQTVSSCTDTVTQV